MGLGLGTVLARAVLPLIVPDREATRPVPDLLVRLPPGRAGAAARRRRRDTAAGHGGVRRAPGGCRGGAARAGRVSEMGRRQGPVAPPVAP
ncbi:hypothetical protein LT493_02900 [Streptomyces tricolor]|nr:hypothetical protein [Streptomyces tricolor]